MGCVTWEFSVCDVSTPREVGVRMQMGYGGLTRSVGALW